MAFGDCQPIPPQPPPPSPRDAPGWHALRAAQHAERVMGAADVAHSIAQAIAARTVEPLRALDFLAIGLTALAADIAEDAAGPEATRHE